MNRVIVPALITGIGYTLHKRAVSSTFKWRALKLMEAGQIAVDNSPLNLRKKSLAMVSKKVMELEKFELPLLLNIVLEALDDMSEHGHKHPQLAKRVAWLYDLYDPKLDDIKMYRKARMEYLIWKN